MAVQRIILREKAGMFINWRVLVYLQVSMGFGTDSRSYMISANWDPTDPHFDVLNIETAKGWC